MASQWPNGGSLTTRKPEGTNFNFRSTLFDPCYKDIIIISSSDQLSSTDSEPISEDLESKKKFLGGASPQTPLGGVHLRALLLTPHLL